MPELVKSIDQAGMNRWAELTGDYNPLHNDPAFAAATRYGGTIIHGHLTVAWLCEWAMAQWGVAWLTGGEISELRFRRPLRGGDEHRIVGEITQSGGGALVKVLTPTGEEGVTASLRVRMARERERNG